VRISVSLPERVSIIDVLVFVLLLIVLGVLGKSFLKAHWVQLLSQDNWGFQRAFGKWWLDLIRNIMVVGVLRYFSLKSNDIVLQIISFITYLALVGYINSFLFEYISTRSIEDPIPSWRKIKLMVLIVSVLIVIFLLRWLDYAVDRIAALQIK
jgi:hypothetical protein